MRIPLKTEPGPKKLPNHQQNRRGPDDEKRYRLLPIHGRKITPKSRGATNDFGKARLAAKPGAPTPLGELLPSAEIRAPPPVFPL
jgi:hypothetical protein